MKNLFTILTMVLLMVVGTATEMEAQKRRGGGNSKSSSSSLDYRLLEWDIMRIGYAVPFSDGLTAGICLSSEGRFNINNKLSASLKWEMAILGGDDTAGGGSVDLGAAISYGIFGDYYFADDSPRRPFAGIGLVALAGGTSETTVNGMTVDTDGGGSIGVVPRIGYELRFLRIAAEFNLPFSSDVPTYLGVHLGLTLGGKYKG